MKQTTKHEKSRSPRPSKDSFFLQPPFIQHKNGLFIRWKVASGGRLKFPGSDSVVIFECSKGT